MYGEREYKFEREKIEKARKVFERTERRKEKMIDELKGEFDLILETHGLMWGDAKGTKSQKVKVCKYIREVVETLEKRYDNALLEINSRYKRTFASFYLYEFKSYKNLMGFETAVETYERKLRKEYKKRFDFDF